MVLVAWLEAVQIRMNPTTHTYIETHIILSNSTCEVTFYVHDLRALYTTAPFHKVLHFDLKFTKYISQRCYRNKHKNRFLYTLP